MSNDPLKELDSLIASLKEKKAKSKEKESNILSTTLSELTSAIRTLLDKFVDKQNYNQKQLSEELKKTIGELKIQSPEVRVPNVIVPEIKIPDIIIPEIKIPTINVPKPQVTVNIPEQKPFPEIKFPEQQKFPEVMKTEIVNVNYGKPLPVILTDNKGNPYIAGSLGGVGGGSGKSIITDILGSGGRSVIDVALDAIKVTGSGFAISQVSGSVDSINVIQLGGNDIALNSGVAGAGVQRVVNVTDVATSVNVIGFTGSIGATILNGDGNSLDPRDRNWSITETVPISTGSTLDVKQVSGANWSIEIASQPFTLDTKQASGGVDSISIASQPFTLDVKQVSGSIDSINVLQYGGTGVAVGTEDGAGVFRVYQVQNAVSSIDVRQINGLTTGFGSGVDNTGVLRVVNVTDVATSVNIIAQDITLAVRQVSGSVDSIEITSQPFSLDIRQVSGSVFSTEITSQPFTLDVKQVSGATDSVSVIGTVAVTQSTTPWVTNMTQVGSNPIDVNFGDASNGTFRTILAHSVNSTTAAVSIGADASTNLVLTTAQRKSVMFTHASTSNLYISTGTAASTTSFPVLANQIVGFEDYTGPVNAIAEEQAGTISVRYIEIA